MILECGLTHAIHVLDAAVAFQRINGRVSKSWLAWLSLAA